MPERLVGVMIFRAAAVALLVCLGPEVAAEPLDVFQDCDVCPVMIELPVGDFIMGAPDDEFRRNIEWRDGAFYPVRPGDHYTVPNEGPQSHVTVDIPFAMARDEVTYDEWMACVNDGGCGGYVPPPVLPVPASPTTIREVDVTGTMPVTNINTADALLYVAWLNRKADTDAYRLPTEAEWEYAARAGTTTRFAQGDTISDKQANFGGKVSFHYGADPRQDLIDRSVPVRVEELDAANAWGLRHMAGNVQELTISCFTDRIPDLPLTSMWKAESQTNGCIRSTRGGYYLTTLDNLRAANRSPQTIIERLRYNGFRLVKEMDEHS